MVLEGYKGLWDVVQLEGEEKEDCFSILQVTNQEILMKRDGIRRGRAWKDVRIVHHPNWKPVHSILYTDRHKRFK